MSSLISAVNMITALRFAERYGEISQVRDINARLYYDDVNYVYVWDHCKHQIESLGNVNLSSGDLDDMLFLMLNKGLIPEHRPLNPFAKLLISTRPLSNGKESIRWFQFNRVRDYFKRKSSRGFGYKRNGKLIFPSGMAIKIPYWCDLSYQVNDQFERALPIFEARYVILESGVKDEETYRDFMSVITIVPFLGQIIEMIFSFIQKTSKFPYPVLDFFGFKNTMSDFIIFQNWDKVVDLIDKLEGYDEPQEYPSDFYLLL